MVAHFLPDTGNSLSKVFSQHVLQEVVQGFQDMTVCWIARRSFDLRKNEIPRWFSPLESLPEPVSVISVVGRLMNWTILFRCLQIADDSSVPLVLEPLALKSVHVFCSQVEEPLQEKCVIQIDPVALVESVALAPLQLQVLLWIQKLSCRVER